MSYPSAEDLNALFVEVLKGRPGNQGERLDWQLTLGDEEDLTGRVKNDPGVDWGTEDGPAYVLDTTVSGVVAERYTGETVTLRYYIDDYAFTRFSGHLLGPAEIYPYTALRAVSGGWWLEEEEVGERREYINSEPWVLVADALGWPIPYGSGMLDIERVTRPRITRQLESAFRTIDKRSDMLGAVAEAVPYTFYDTPDGGHEAALVRSVSDLGDPAWTFVAGEEFQLTGELKVEGEEDLYREVVVVRPKQNPAPTEEPIEELARVVVPGSKALKGTAFPIEVSDYSATAIQDAIETAFDEARDRAFGRKRLTWPCRYHHPTLRRGMVVAVINLGQDERGRYQDTYHAILDGEGGHLPTKRGRYSGRGERIERTYARRRLPAPGAVTPGVTRPAFGLNHLTELYFEEGLEWVATESVSGDLVFFSDDAGHAQVDAPTGDLVVARGAP